MSNICCLFEDKEESVLSEFYKRAFDGQCDVKLIFCGGNSSLEKEAKECLKSNEYKQIVIFMDLVPRNKNIVIIYNKLRALSKANNFRIIVIPVISSEYILIKSINAIEKKLKVNLIDRNKDEYAQEFIDRLLDKKPYSDIPLVQSCGEHKFKYYFNTLEKLSKYIVNTYLIECATIKQSKMTCRFYTCDCECEYKLPNCDGIGSLCVHEKAKNFVKHFPCYPVLSKESNVLSLDELWKIHRDAIDEFNSMNNLFIEFDKQLLKTNSCNRLDVLKYYEKELEYIK